MPHGKRLNGFARCVGIIGGGALKQRSLVSIDNWHRFRYNDACESRPEGRLGEVDLKAGARAVPARGVTTRSRAAWASCLPALRPAREVHRLNRPWRRRPNPPPRRRRVREAWPRLSLWDETLPQARAVGGTPAGERARKRRAAQAAISVARPARRLRADHETLRLPAFRFLRFLPGVLRRSDAPSGRGIDASYPDFAPLIRATLRRCLTMLKS